MFRHSYQYFSGTLNLIKINVYSIFWSLNINLLDFSTYCVLHIKATICNLYLYFLFFVRTSTSIHKPLFKNVDEIKQNKTKNILSDKKQLILNVFRLIFDCCSSTWSQSLHKWLPSREVKNVNYLLVCRNKDLVIKPFHCWSHGKHHIYTINPVWPLPSRPNEGLMVIIWLAINAPRTAENVSMSQKSLLCKVEPSQTYKKFTQANANKHDAGCYSQLQKSELFFLNTKKGQRKKNGPESRWWLVRIKG